MSYQYWPEIIQGGMGVGVSNWTLAQAVSRLGQLGVVSGTALETVMVRRLQLGDKDGSTRRALASFPLPKIAETILERFFIPGGKDEKAPFAMTPMHSLKSAPFLNDLTVAASFVEVFLAKEGHSNPVGMNLLTKIKLPTIPTLYGALLAGVDYILMGAGIPLKIPGILNDLVKGNPTGQKIEAIGGKEDFWQSFDPTHYFPKNYPTLRLPKFFPIISSTILGITMVKKANGPVDGLIIEYPVAGGHNAPPRDKNATNEQGEPLYSDRDIPDLEKIKQLGVPFWLAGGCASKEKLKKAKAMGATGVQIGSAFAFCRESGITDALKQKTIKEVKSGRVQIKTDGRISPTGFPFKVVQMPETISDPQVVADRTTRCDLGYLRELAVGRDEKVHYRCPAENICAYIKKEGNADDTEGRRCLCNSLCATVGLGQTRKGYEEPPLITAGDSLRDLTDFISEESDHYSAADVIEKVLA